jgi:peroxiredoxin
MSPQTRFPLAALLPILSTICLAKADDGVAMSAMEAKPLKAGTKAPESLLTNLEGKQENLSSILSIKPTVLIFYRGGWCPFCNTHLAELGKIESDIRKKGYQIVAISPDLPSELNKTLDKQHLTYKLYSDASAEAMKKFGVAYRLDDKTFTMYRDSYKIDLEKSSGQKHHILPVPSVFIIDRSGKITFVSSNPDYKVRMKGSEILKAIESK